MKERLRELVTEITRLEDELQTALHTQESELLYLGLALYQLLCFALFPPPVIRPYLTAIH